MPAKPTCLAFHLQTLRLNGMAPTEYSTVRRVLSAKGMDGMVARVSC
jgi:hypothetical protein